MLPELIINYTLMMPTSVSADLGFYADGNSYYLRNVGTYLPVYRSVTCQDRATVNTTMRMPVFISKVTTYFPAQASKYTLAILTAQFYMRHLRIRFYV